MTAAPDDPLARHSLSPGELKRLLATERTGEPFVAYRDAEDHLALRPLSRDGRTLTIGRRPETDLVVAWDHEVSGLHAELHGIGGEWTIIDDGLSTNGTFVNGRRVNGRQRLRSGDRVRTGRTIFVYHAGGPAPVPPTVAAADAPPLPELTATQRKVLIALCRPYRDTDDFTTPATNQQIADELFLSVDAIKMHLRTLFSKFDLLELPQNEKRVRLAECALRFGVISRHELD